MKISNIYEWKIDAWLYAVIEKMKFKYSIQNQHSKFIYLNYSVGAIGLFLNLIQC